MHKRRAILIFSILNGQESVRSCGRLDRRQQRYRWLLAVCPISSASGSDTGSYYAECRETVYS